jgi:hypothetical protein
MPSKHTNPFAQAIPQEPQLRTSVAVLTHVPLQMMKPEGHKQVPPTQNGEIFVQTMPQEPQFIGSFWRSTQSPSQTVVPDRHPGMHMPFKQMVPLGQALPHAPQLS